MGDLVRKALETATALENAVPPDKAPIVRNLLNQSGLVLAASTPALMFAGFMEQMDNSTDLSAEDKIALREVLVKEQAIVTGRDVRRQTLTMLTDPQTGEQEPAYTMDHPKELRTGVESFTTKGKDIYLR